MNRREPRRRRPRRRGCHRGRRSRRCCSCDARAPDGSYFHDGDRAAGVFGVLATGFAVLLGFVVFLAFTSYDAARAGAEAEAVDGRPAGRDGAVLPAGRGRASSPPSWSATPARSPASSGSAWSPGRSASRSTRGRSSCSGRCGRSNRRRHPSSPPTTTGSTRPSAREEARSDRIHGAVGVIPTPLWLVLFFSAGLIFVFMLFFADSGERAVVQALLIGVRGRGDHGDAPVAQLPRRSVPRRRSAVCARSRWNGRWRSSPRS